MGYGVDSLNFRSGRMDPFPQDAIVSVLIRHGCRVPQLREGSNGIGLPDKEAGYCPVGDSASLEVKNGEITGFGPGPPTSYRAVLGVALLARP